MLSLLPTRAIRHGSPVIPGGLNSGLRHWWIKLPGRGGAMTWPDICGRNPFTLTNMTADDWVASKFTPSQSGSLTFDGSNDHGIPALNPPVVNNLTIMQVVRPVQADIDNSTTSFALTNSATDANFQIRWGASASDSSIPYAVLVNNAASAGTNTASGVVTSAGQWVVVWAGLTSANVPRLAVNGSAWGTDGASPGGTINFTGMVLGARYFTAALGRYFTGQIAETRFYEGILGDQQRAEIYRDLLLGYPRTLRRQSTMWVPGVGTAAAPGNGAGPLVWGQPLKSKLRGLAA